MIIVPKPSEEGFTRERVPAGTHQAVCQSVHDVGIQETTYNGETKRQHTVIIVWEVNERLTEGKFAGQRFVVSKKYTLSLHEKSTLRHDLMAWRGRDFTDAELNAFDLESITGANCMLSITEVKKGEKTYTNIAAVMALPKGMAKITPELENTHRFDWIEKMKAAGTLTDELPPAIKAATAADVVTVAEDPFALGGDAL